MFNFHQPILAAIYQTTFTWWD